MKKIYIGLITLILASPLFLMATSSPFPSWISKLVGEVSINKYGQTSITEEASDGETTYGLKVARFVYDVAVDGGAVGPHTLETQLPAKAVIKQSWYKIITQFSDSGSGTVALSCEDANNILTAGDITGISANAITTGASTGSAATMVRGIGSACNITATVAGVTQDTGKLVGWVEYVIEN